MLYFVIGKEPNEQEITWHVGGGLPRIARVDKIYADGHELQYLQSLGFASDKTNGYTTFHGEQANQVLRAMRGELEKAPKSSKPEWVHNTPIEFRKLSLPEQLIYAAAFGAYFAVDRRSGAHTVGMNALYSFWRKNGHLHHSIPTDESFRFGDDDWGK